MNARGAGGQGGVFRLPLAGDGVASDGTDILFTR
jgi:hypothetical protein